MQPSPPALQNLSPTPTPEVCLGLCKGEEAAATNRSLMQSLPHPYDFLTTQILLLRQEAPQSARHYLPRRRAALLRRLLAAHQSLREIVNNMDYILAGITALFLFCYLIYALLKPEKF